jgi:glycosyltransferase involved in cell wall biosynthesis
MLSRSSMSALTFVMIGNDSKSAVQALRDSFEENAPAGTNRRFVQIPEVSRGELPSLLRSLDLLLLLSRREGMPNTILESLACGTPVAATAVDGVVDIMQGTGVGLLLDRFDRSSAATEIIQLLQDKSTMESMRQRGPELIREQYMLTHELDALRRIYESLLSSHRESSLCETVASQY